MTGALQATAMREMAADAARHARALVPPLRDATAQQHAAHRVAAAWAAALTLVAATVEWADDWMPSHRASGDDYEARPPTPQTVAAMQDAIDRASDAYEAAITWVVLTVAGNLDSPTASVADVIAAHRPHVCIGHGDYWADHDDPGCALRYLLRDAAVSGIRVHLPHAGADDGHGGSMWMPTWGAAEVAALAARLAPQE